MFVWIFGFPSSKLRRGCLRCRDAAKEPHNAHENGSRHANGHDKHMNADAARPLVDGACAQRGDIRYGLNISGDAPDEAERCAL